MRVRCLACSQVLQRVEVEGLPQSMQGRGAMVGLPVPVVRHGYALTRFAGHLAL